MRLLFLGAGLDGVSWRFRVAQYLPRLRAMGIEADVADLGGSLRRRWRALGAAARYDAVCVHRAFLSPFEIAWLRRAAPRYVFDFDDAIMLRDSAAGRFDSRQRRRRFGRAAGGAAAAIAGNAYLAEHARRYQAHVTVIPSAVDPVEYSAAAGDAEPIIGWIGTRINLMYVRPLIGALARVTQRRPAARIKIVSDGVLDAPDLPLINKAWARADEAADLRSFQVGIMPLPDDPWTRGKCALKILQYFAAGLPVVCSPVGANLDVVEHGRNGYFASTPDEWTARLEELLGDDALRRRFGEHGRALVAERYSVDVVLPRLLEVLLPR